MTKPHRNAVVAGHTRLYHYEKFSPDWLAGTLSEQKIHCSNPSNLNDPWDCRPCFDDQSLKTEEQLDEFFQWLSEINKIPFPAVKQQALNDGIYGDPKKLAEHLKQFSAVNSKKIAEHRIYCLTPDPISTLMWSHYAENHKGICLEFRADNNFLLPMAQEVIYRSTYPQWKPQDFSADIALEMILTKADAWSYEKEFRLVGHPHRSDLLKVEGERFSLPSGALASVIVGCQGDYDAVRTVVDKHAPGLPVKQVVRTPNHFSLSLDGFLTATPPMAGVSGRL